MTSDHVRRALILLFIFNLVLVYQNWETGRKINTLEKNIAEAVQVINAAKGIEKKLSASHELTNQRLDNVGQRLDKVSKCLENGC